MNWIAPAAGFLEMLLLLYVAVIDIATRLIRNEICLALALLGTSCSRKSETAAAPMPAAFGVALIESMNPHWNDLAERWSEVYKPTVTGAPREIPRPAGENAGLRDDAF